MEESMLVHFHVHVHFCQIARLSYNSVGGDF